MEIDFIRKMIQEHCDECPAMKDLARRKAKPKPKKNIPAIDFDWDNGQFVGISAHDTIAWIKAYPAVNTMQATFAAAQWLLSNPQKEKKNYRRFLTNWLARAQERGGSRSEQTSNQPPLAEHQRKG